MVFPKFPPTTSDMNLFSLSYYYIAFRREIQMSLFLKEARLVLWYNRTIE